MNDAVKTIATSAFAVASLASCGGSAEGDMQAEPAARSRTPPGQPIALAAQGRHIFRFDTFGDEAKWTDTLRMHEVIRTAVDPVTALTVGLKVDADALPATVVAGIKDGSIDLHSPATTVVFTEGRAAMRNPPIVAKARHAKGMENLRRNSTASVNAGCPASRLLAMTCRNSPTPFARRSQAKGCSPRTACVVH